MSDKVSALKENEVVVIRFDNLPENFPLSFVYDIVEFAGGKYDDIEEARVIDDFSAELEVAKDTAFKIVKYIYFYLVLRLTVTTRESTSNLR